LKFSKINYAYMFLVLERLLKLYYIKNDCLWCMVNMVRLWDSLKGIITLKVPSHEP
jgi:hypothetical protein